MSQPAGFRFDDGPPMQTARLRVIELETYVLLGIGLGLALLIAIWGLWKLK